MVNHLLLIMIEFRLVKTGIWDVLSNQEVVDFVTQRIGQAMEPEDICEELMTRLVVLYLQDNEGLGIC